jgi:uncharacterized protein YkwD
MKYKIFSFHQLLIFTFLLTLSTAVSAQFKEPDEQIKRAMLAYLDRIESTSTRSSKQQIYQPVSTANVAYRGDARVTSGGSSANYAIERRAFDILNQQRAGKGLQPLRWSEDAARVARLHSENMARYRFFSHEGRDGSHVNNRAKSLGIRGFSSIGENIAFNKGFRKPVEMACQHWMTSPGHRENILDRGWTESGVGVAVTADGSYYFTQVFITR